MATCGGALPFPNFAFEPWNLKGMKLHFLAYYYHLTGYERAKEVMHEVIQGAVRFTRKFNEQIGAERLVGGRENYNMNRFWATAYQETHDPEIAEFARQSREVTLNREYDADTLSFGTPKVYLYDGFVLQDHVFRNQQLETVMLSHLQGTMLENPGRGIRDPQDVIACDWAYRKTRDLRFAQLARDLAQGYADLVPDIDLDSPSVPDYPYAYCGNRLFRQHLLPMLIGAGLGQVLEDRGNRERWFRDLFLHLRRDRPGQPHRGTAYVLPRSTGKLRLRIHLRVRGSDPVTVRATNREGEIVTQASSSSQSWIREIVLTVPAAGPEIVYRLDLSCQNSTAALIEGAASIVWHTPLEHLHANEPLCGGQNYTPQYVYTKSCGGPVGYFNRQQRPYAIREVQTGHLLLRGQRFTQEELSAPVEAGRMIEFTLRGCRSPSEWRLSGVAPFVSAIAEDWFDPRDFGWDLD
jgi:hypothetical protein